MDGINSAWWLALVIAVPLSIFSNIVTTFLQRRWADRPKRRISAKIGALERRIQAAETQIQASGDPKSFGVWVLVYTGAIAAGFALLTGIGFSASSALYSFHLVDGMNADLGMILSFGSSIVGAFGSLVVFKVLLRSMALIGDMQALARLKAELQNLRDMTPAAGNGTS